MTGSVTAGNSSQTSDGAAAVMVMDREKAESLGLEANWQISLLCSWRGTAGNNGVGPVVAVPKALKLAGLEVSDIGLIRIK